MGNRDRLDEKEAWKQEGHYGSNNNKYGEMLLVRYSLQPRADFRNYPACCLKF